MRVGLDIGGTSTAGILLDGTSRPLHEVRLASGYGGPEVLATAERAVRELTAAAGTDVTALRSVGVGVPGLVAADRRHVTNAVNLGLAELDLGGRLAERLGVAVVVENDVNAAALGAHRLLGGGTGSLGYLNLGTGLACGIVLAGRLWRGDRGVAGEIGHVPVDPAGPLCRCGQRGCLEAVCAGWAIARDWPGPGGATAVFAAADGGDRAARALADRVCGGIAAAVRLLALTVDVDRILLGGGVSRAGAPLLRGVRAALAAQAQRSALVAALNLPARVTILPASGTAAMLGAAALAEVDGVPA